MSCASFSAALNDSSHRHLNNVSIEDSMVLAQKILSINEWHPSEIQNLLENYRNIESILIKNFYAMLMLLSDLHHIKGSQEIAVLFISQELLYKNAWYASLDVAQLLNKSDEWNFKANPAWRAAVEGIDDARDDVIWKNHSNLYMTDEQNASLYNAEQNTRKTLAREAFEGTKHALEKLNLEGKKFKISTGIDLATIYILALLSQRDSTEQYFMNFFVILNNCQLRPLSGLAFNESMSKIMKRQPDLEHNTYFVSCKKLMEAITVEQ